ncbi:MAG: hypothetical protein K8W52_46090 [Deltaproteobacteria bacterium]|nr:hypothetical protein [Deltaproteobacteria bacterium]
MFALLFRAALQLSTLHTCGHGTPFDDSAQAVGCSETELVTTVPFAVDTLTITATDDCPGQSSMIYAKTATQTVFCTVKDGATTECVLKDLPAGAKVYFQCRGDGSDDGSGCSYKVPTLT